MEVLVDEFLKVKSYERSRRRVLLEESSNNIDLQSFMMFLQARRKLRQSSKLSFALNLENDSLKFAAKPVDSLTKHTRRKSRVTKKDIPESFIKHILSLGFQKADSHVLYENKDDWLGMQKGWLKLQF